MYSLGVIKSRGFWVQDCTHAQNQPNLFCARACARVESKKTCVIL